VNANVYQVMAMRTAGPAFNPDDGLILSALGLCGETGEYAEHVKKHVYHGHALDKPRVSKELGDIAWYLARACEANGLRLGDVMQENITKLQERYPEGFTSEKSIYRADS
jgi:NTP pyrophosphatase (non-canonical NTP hydrolase)